MNRLIGPFFGIGVGITTWTYLHNFRPSPLLTKDYTSKKKGENIITLSNEGALVLETDDTALCHSSIPGGCNRIPYKELLRSELQYSMLSHKKTLDKLSENPYPPALRGHGEYPLLFINETLTDEESHEIEAIIKDSHIEARWKKPPLYLWTPLYEKVPSDYIK